MIRALALAITVVCACTCEPAPPSAPPPAKAPVEQAPVEQAPDAKVPELSEEDLRLIAADPKTLTPEERRKRGFALRRKIMQNPDSPTAKMLEDLRRAAENGELPPPGKDGSPMKLERRTANGLPPAGAPASDDPATKAP
jgi:hypothetical protein